MAYEIRNGYYIIFRPAKYIIRQRRISYRDSGISLKKMSDNILLDLSLEFSIAIVNLVDNIDVPKSSYMTNQLARAGTSVGANIHEAQYAHGRKDFTAKLEIALKEASETSYWLKLMFETNRISENQYRETERICGNIRRLLIASCRTAKEKI